LTWADRFALAGRPGFFSGSAELNGTQESLGTRQQRERGLRKGSHSVIDVSTGEVRRY
jgi:hypothetical protein